MQCHSGRANAKVPVSIQQSNQRRGSKMRMMSTGTALALALIVTSPAVAKPGDPGREKVAAAIKADHDASIDRLRKWIALPTIANMGINHQEGAEYMRQL